EVCRRRRRDDRLRLSTEAGPHTLPAHNKGHWRIAVARARPASDPRAARHAHRAARRFWRLFLFLLARHVAVPERMMETRPAAGHRATRHGPERSRLRGRAEIDVSDDAD